MSWLDADDRAVRRLEAAISAMLPLPEIDYTAEDVDEMPCTWGECQTRGLGTTEPCPFYRCRHHLGLNISPDGEMRILIQPDQLEEAEETCSLVAARHARISDDVAVKIGLSLGGFELVQRHACAKANAAMARVRDVTRGAELDVNGIPDCR